MGMTTSRTETSKPGTFLLQRLGKCHLLGVDLPRDSAHQLRGTFLILSGCKFFLLDLLASSLRNGGLAPAVSSERTVSCSKADVPYHGRLQEIHLEVSHPQSAAAAGIMRTTPFLHGAPRERGRTCTAQDEGRRFSQLRK